MRKRPDELYGIPISELARICCVSLKTARRWKLGQTVPPKSALMILAGDLGAMDPEWRGWTVHHGELISPEGWRISVNAVLATPLLRAQIHALQTEVRRFKALDNQPAAEPVAKSKTA